VIGRSSAPLLLSKKMNMKKVLKENIRLILGSLSVLIYMGLMVRRLVLYNNFIDRVTDLDLSNESVSILIEAGSDVSTIRIAIFTLILIAVLFLIYKKQ
jgi:hypothetical protein